jgi:hypothetical protein
MTLQDEININFKKKKNKCGKFVWKQRWNRFLSWLIKIDWRKRVLRSEKNHYPRVKKVNTSYLTNIWQKLVSF